MCDAGQPVEFKPGDEPTALYRLFDTKDVVIRIGITITPADRMINYGARESWWPEVARGTMEWYPTRQQACAAETRAIKAEKPKYNIRKRSSAYVPLRRPPITPEEKAKIIAEYQQEKKAAFDAGEWVDIFPGGPGRQAFGKWSTPEDPGERRAPVAAVTH